MPHPSESSKRRRRHALTSDQVLRQQFLHFRHIWAASGMSSVPYSQIREFIKEPRKFGTSWSQWFSCLQPPSSTHARQKTGSPNWSYGPVPALRVDLSQLGHIWLLFWSSALWTVKHMKTDLDGFVHETDHMLPLPLTRIYRNDNNGGIFRIPFFFSNWFFLRGTLKKERNIPAQCCHSVPIYCMAVLRLAQPTDFSIDFIWSLTQSQEL